MRTKLPTRNFFIDTSIFQENNFFHGTKIQSLLNYGKIGVINLFMTNISKIEFINRVKTLLKDCKEEHNKFVRHFNNQEFRVLRNLDLYQDLKSFPISITDSLAKIENKLETNIKVCNIKVLSASGVNIDDVFELYYNSLPPFSEGKKRYEFPDAFIIKTLDNYCQENKIKICILTKDNDFNGYKSRHLIFKNNLEDVLVKITKYYDEHYKLNSLSRVTAILKAYRETILELIRENIKDKFELHTDREEILQLTLNNIFFDNEKIIAFRDDFAEVLYNVKIEFSAFRPASLKEIETSFFEEDVKPKKIVKYEMVPVDIEVYFKGNRNVKVKWINSTQPIKIQIYN